MGIRLTVVEVRPTPYAAHEAAGETGGDEREIRRVL